MVYQHTPPNEQVDEPRLDRMNFDNLQQNVPVLTAFKSSGFHQTVSGEYATTRFYAELETMCDICIEESISQQIEQSGQLLGWLTYHPNTLDAEAFNRAKAIIRKWKGKGALLRSNK